MISSGTLTAQQDDIFTELESVPINSLSITETYEETPPQHPGGEVEFFKYLLKNQQYPIDAKNLGIEGNVAVSFKILKDGSVDKNSVRVVSSPSNLLNKEAIRLITNSPNWVPAMKLKGGKTPLPIDFELTLPVLFRIK